MTESPPLPKHGAKKPYGEALLLSPSSSPPTPSVGSSYPANESGAVPSYSPRAEMGATATRAGSHVCGVRGCPRKCCWRVNREAPKYVAPLGVAFFVSSCLAVRMLRSFSWGRAGRGVQLVPPPHLPPRQLHAAPDRCTPQPPQSPQQALRTLRSSLCAPRHPPRPPGRQQTPTQRSFLSAIPEPFLRIHARNTTLT